MPSAGTLHGSPITAVTIGIGFNTERELFCCGRGPGMPNQTRPKSANARLTADAPRASQSFLSERDRREMSAPTLRASGAQPSAPRLPAVS